MARSTFVYVTYIRATPEKLWSALTDDVEFMKQYWFGMHHLPGGPRCPLAFAVNSEPVLLHELHVVG